MQATWAKVDEETIKHGLVAVAGTVNTTGIGGYVYFSLSVVLASDIQTV